MEYIEKLSFSAKLELLMSIILLIIVIVLSYRMPDIVEVNAKTTDNNTYTVIIDPGHGGNDPGKIAVNNAQEKDINLSVSLKLKEIMEEEGITVIMTRETDEGLYDESDSNKKSADLQARCEIINDVYAEGDRVIAVSIHQNSYTSEDIKGAQVFYYSKSEEGKKLAEIIQESFIKNLDGTNTRVAKANDNYYMLLNTDCPAVIVECGFLSNWTEATLLVDEDYQQKVADAVYEGIKEYLGIK